MKYRTTGLICLLIIAMCGKTAAELDTLEKLRTRDWDVWLGDGGYDLALMGDQAAAFLVEVLTDENEDARWHAHYFLDRYYGDSSILPELTELFLKGENISVRQDAAYLISTIDAVYARKLMFQYLNDEETQNIATNVLISLRDKRMIPRLIAQLEDPKIDYGRRRYVISELVNFKHKSVVPILLDTLNNFKFEKKTQEEIVEKIANIGDVRALPILFSYLDSQSNLSRKIINAFSQSDPSIVQPLLEKLEQLESIKSSYMRQAIFEILENQTDPAFIPIYEKIIFGTDDSKPQTVMVRALGNMGEKGFESLLNIVRQKPNSMAVRVLATYNSAAAIDAITSLALDKSFPYQKDAIQAFLRYGSIGKAEVSKHITKLLNDVNPKEKLVIIEALPQLGDSWKAEIYKHLTLLLADTDLEVQLLTIDLIRQMNLTAMAPALKKLAQDAKETTRNAAHNAHDILTGKPQLQLAIKMSQQQYDYGQLITLTYHITNVSDYPTTIAFYKTLASRFLKLEIQQPDGTLAKYMGPIAKLAPLTINSYQTIEPGNEITDTIPVSKFYNLHQSGAYIAQLQVSSVRGGVILPSSFFLNDKNGPPSKRLKLRYFRWSSTLISPKVPFKIEPPPADKLNKMIASIDPELITEDNALELVKICVQLGELRKPAAIPALKKLALINAEYPNNFRHRLQDAAGRALLKFSDSGMVPTWIEILDKKSANPTGQYFDHIEVLGASGDTRAIEPLRQIAFRPGNYELPIKASLAMQQLGDNSGVEWHKKVAFRKLRHWKEDERFRGAVILARLEPLKKPNYKRLPDLRDPLFYAENYELHLNWAKIYEKASTLNGLKELLKHENLIIQRAAAYQLAYRGDKSGIHFLQRDLHADDSQTRMHARDTFFNLPSQ